MDKAPKPAASLAAHFQTPLGVQALTLLSLIVVWECIGRTGLLFPDLFPSVVEILQSLWIYVTTPVMIPHLKASLYEVGGVGMWLSDAAFKFEVEEVYAGLFGTI
ncbi:MAG TPA: hypothetical protein VLM90_09280, partial [Candidatus Deferrimicrobium sp.]|nr:hypothetical protein [Candidatus Deferrimicrobium sp.]